MTQRVRVSLKLFEGIVKALATLLSMHCSDARGPD